MFNILERYIGLHILLYLTLIFNIIIYRILTTGILGCVSQNRIIKESIYIYRDKLIKESKWK